MTSEILSKKSDIRIGDKIRRENWSIKGKITEGSIYIIKEVERDHDGRIFSVGFICDNGIIIYTYPMFFDSYSIITHTYTEDDKYLNGLI